MENSRKIDRSIKERQGVLQLLESLKKENITYAEMDEIGSLIRKAGRSAVQPLLRRISHEKSGLLISKYTYLLDFLDDRYWLDQIIQIALKRRDLEYEGKSAILATLEDCGIDISAPPFSTLLASSASSAPELFSRLIDKGEEGILTLLEEFCCQTIELKRSFLFEMTQRPDERMVDFLELLLWHDDPDVAAEVVAALGRMKFSSALHALQRFSRYAAPVLQRAVDTSLKRLTFMGVQGGPTPRQTAKLPFHSAYAGPVDGNGYRSVLIARWRKDDTLDVIDLQLHDGSGLADVWGVCAESPEQFEKTIAERIGQELLEPVAPEYAMALLCDALSVSSESGYPLPPEFMLRRRMFEPEELVPCRYSPPQSVMNLKITPLLLSRSATLFDDEFFAGWAVESCLVYDTAEEWIKLEQKHGEGGEAPLERLIENLCREEFQPRLAEIAQRILCNADFLARTGTDDDTVRMAVAAAYSIREFSLPCHLHPFLRRFAMESMIVAREAMEEGYDLRSYQDDWD